MVVVTLNRTQRVDVLSKALWLIFKETRIVPIGFHRSGGEYLRDKITIIFR